MAAITQRDFDRFVCKLADSLTVRRDDMGDEVAAGLGEDFTNYSGRKARRRKRLQRKVDDTVDRAQRVAAYARQVEHAGKIYSHFPRVNQPSTLDKLVDKLVK